MSKKRADAYCSLFVRLRDIINNQYSTCCYCGGWIDWRYADNAHYFKRGNNAVRYSEVNCNASHRECNQYDESSNDKQGYTKYLKLKYGKDVIEKLERLKNSTMKDLCYDEIADFYKQKSIDMAALKGQDISRELKLYEKY